MLLLIRPVKRKIFLFVLNDSENVTRRRKRSEGSRKVVGREKKERRVLELPP